MLFKDYDGEMSKKDKTYWSSVRQSRLVGIYAKFIQLEYVIFV